MFYRKWILKFSTFLKVLVFKNARFAAQVNDLSLTRYLGTVFRAEFLAHCKLMFSHKHKPVTTSWPAGAGFVVWVYCKHRSHRVKLPCWRWREWDSVCMKHYKCVNCRRY